MVQYNKSSFGYSRTAGIPILRGRASRQFMRTSLMACALAGMAMIPACSASTQGEGTIALWLTTPERSSLLAEQSIPLRFVRSASEPRAIEVDNHQKFQTIDGFGQALTGGSAQLLMRMDAPRRTALLRELFGRGNGGIKISYLR